MIELNYEAAKEGGEAAPSRAPADDIASDIAFCAVTLYGSHPRI